MFAKKCFVLLWISLIHQCFGIKQDPLHQNISDRTLSLNLNLQHSVDDSSASTVVAIDPIKSFLLWTIIEALALGLLTTAAFGTMHSYHPRRYYPNFYHAPHTHYEDFDLMKQELKAGHERSPIATDALRPTHPELYHNIVKNNSTKISRPCSLNITKETNISTPQSVP